MLNSTEYLVVPFTYPALPSHPPTFPKLVRLFENQSRVQMRSADSPDLAAADQDTDDVPAKRLRTRTRGSLPVTPGGEDGGGEARRTVDVVGNNPCMDPVF